MVDSISRQSQRRFECLQNRILVWSLFASLVDRRLFIACMLALIETGSDATNSTPQKKKGERYPIPICSCFIDYSYPDTFISLYRLHIIIPKESNWFNAYSSSFNEVRTASKKCIELTHRLRHTKWMIWPRQCLAYFQIQTSQLQHSKQIKT